MHYTLPTFADGRYLHARLHYVYSRSLPDPVVTDSVIAVPVRIAFCLPVPGYVYGPRYHPVTLPPFPLTFTILRSCGLHSFYGRSHGLRLFAVPVLLTFTHVVYTVAFTFLFVTLPGSPGSFYDSV